MSASEICFEEIIDFSSPQRYTFTTPVSCTYFGIAIRSHTWQDVYQGLVRSIVADYPERFLEDVTLPGSAYPYIGDGACMMQPVPVANGLSLETAVLTDDIVVRLGHLLALCGIDPINVVIRCLATHLVEGARPKHKNPFFRSSSIMQTPLGSLQETLTAESMPTEAASEAPAPHSSTAALPPLSASDAVETARQQAPHTNVQCTYGITDLTAASWPDLYHEVVKRAAKEYPEYFERPFSLSGKHTIDVGPKERMVDPRPVTHAFYLECALTPAEIRANIQRLAKRCRMPSGKICRLEGPLEPVASSVTSGQQTAARTSQIASQSLPARTPASQASSVPSPDAHSANASSEHEYDDSLRDAALTIIERFPRSRMRLGFGPHARKFCQWFLDLTGAPLPDEIDIDDLISSVGFVIGGMVYVVPDEYLEEIRSLVEFHLAQGVRIFMCEEMFSRHQQFLEQERVVSSELLRQVLLRLFPQMHSGGSLFTTDQGATLEDEILACFADAMPVLSVEQLHEVLEYVSESDIQAVLDESSLFEPAGPRTYVPRALVHLSENDVRESRRTIGRRIGEAGHASFADICVDDTVSMNPSVQKTTLRKLLYEEHLRADYERRGAGGSSLVPVGGAYRPVTDDLRRYCDTHEHVTLDELTACEARRGQVTSGRALKIATQCLVRVSQSEFVASRLVKFDIGAIDKAIGFVMGGRSVISLRDLASSASLPTQRDYVWNPYILRSFLRQSRRFAFLGSEREAAVEGAVCIRTLGLNSYKAALAHAVAESGPKELDAASIALFLREAGYLVRGADTTTIALQARSIREMER